MLRPAVIFASLLLGGVVATAGDKIRLDDLPAAVRATVEEELAGGRVEDIELETRDGETVFEVDIRRVSADGTGLDEWEIQIDASGRLVSRQLD
jgi:hypothetical protein